MNPIQNLQITLSELNNLFNYLAESGGEISPELEAELSKLELKSAQSVDGAEIILKRLEVEKDYFKNLADQYYKASKAMDNVKERIRSQIKETMLNNGTTVLEGNQFRFKLSPAQPRLVLEGNLDPKYTVKVITIEPDKEKIKEDLKEGLSIKGARLEPSYSLRSYVGSKKQP